MSKGDIILIPFLFTDLSGQKVRPALVLYAEKKSGDCVVAFLSSMRPRRISFFDLPVISSNRNGLKIQSLVKVNKIATLEKKLFLGQLGKLESSYMTQVDNKLRRLLGL